MAEKKDWITLKNGVHVPVGAGQSKKEAIQEHWNKSKEKTEAKSTNTANNERLNTILNNELPQAEKELSNLKTQIRKNRESGRGTQEERRKQNIQQNKLETKISNLKKEMEQLRYSKEKYTEKEQPLYSTTEEHRQKIEKADKETNWNDFFQQRLKAKQQTKAQDKKDTDINGYVTYYDVPMTKAGVFPYLGKTISPELEPDKVYNVLRPIEELTKPETLKSLEAVPLVIDHTMIGEGFTKPEDKGVEGTTLQNVKVKGDLITNDLTAYTDRCRQAIDAGKRDLSMGYRCRYDLTSGEYKGQHYDAVQRDIIYNHIALVEEGRMGAECRVTDNSIVYDSLDINLHNKKEFVKMAKITLDEDLKQEIKEEIKKELLDGGAEIIEKKEDVIDETAPEVQEPEQSAEDEDTDKRKLIDEIGGILKGKIDDELIRTVMQKAEELAYNPSETGANDCNTEGQDADTEAEPGKKDGLSMDEAVKYFAKRDNLINRLKPVIGDNVNYNQMTVEQVVKYGCDKLDIPVSLRGLEGYLTAAEKHKKTYVTIAKDSAERQSNTAAFLQAYKSKD